MMNQSKLYCIVILGWLGLSGMPVYANSVITHDVRVLIDVSGSMKYSDPAAMRIPALKLFFNLLPNQQGIQAGAWMFAEDVHKLIEVAPVDSTWKNKIDNKVTEIHSNGLFTDIGQAVHVATADWLISNKKVQRDLVLLTDGVMQISEDPQVNEQLRHYLLTSQLRELKAKGIRIHTIALSANADQDLLQTLSFQTQGVFSAVYDAKNLMMTFVRFIDAIIGQNQIPWIGNTFKIDSSVQQSTLLLWHPPNSKQQIILKTPEGKQLTQKSKEVSAWDHNDIYDLISLKKPSIGIWRVLGPHIDIDNRIIIESSLNIMLRGISHDLLLFQPKTLEIALMKESHLVSDSKLFSQLTVQLKKRQIQTGQRWRTILYSSAHDAAPPNKATFLYQQLGNTVLPGNYEISAVIEGKDFARKKSQPIIFHDQLVTYQIKQQKQKTKIVYQIHLIPIAGMLSPKTMKLTAEIKQFKARQLLKTVHLHMDPNWFLNLPLLNSNETYQLSFHFQGNMANGQPIDWIQPAVWLNYQGTIISSQLSSELLHKPINRPSLYEQKIQENASEYSFWIILLWSIFIILNSCLVVVAYRIYRRILWTEQVAFSKSMAEIES